MKIKNYTEWLDKVDQNLITICGIGYMDLPDMNYLDMFEADYTPAEAASEVIRSLGEGVTTSLI